MLDARLDKRLGPFRLEVSFQVARASTLALVGESGSGKTTVLRLLAGLLSPDRGRIALAEGVWFDGERRIDRPTRFREVGYVAQDYALFPHLDVAANVAFGLQASGIAGAEARRRTAAILGRLAISELAGRRPAELSGGQQQRVALARALVLEPGLLLLDEPLAALDLKTRRAVRGELRRLLADLPCVTVFVTHDPTEAMLFGDQVAVLDAGRVSQAGPREELLRHPRSEYVAELMGVNLLRGVIVSPPVDGLARVDVGGGVLLAPAAEPGEVWVLVNPREIVISPERPSGSAQNVLMGAIAEISPEPPLGERLRLVIATRPPLVAEVTAHAARALGLVPGREVFATFKASGVTTFR